ncbi:hypothetical protein BDZ89DRAFT_259907 [Hymenopellis radicata]|nr:hypothetical protein BDZ89DRAFT_259907 [Hymenopellis radicata]
MDRWPEDPFADSRLAFKLDRGFIFGTNAVSFFEAHDEEFGCGPFWALARTVRETIARQAQKHNEAVKNYWVSCYPAICRDKHWIDVVPDTVLNYRVTHDFELYPPAGDTPYRPSLHTHLRRAVYTSSRLHDVAKHGTSQDRLKSTLGI